MATAADNAAATTARREIQMLQDQLRTRREQPAALLMKAATATVKNVPAGSPAKPKNARPRTTPLCAQRPRPRPPHVAESGAHKFSLEADDCSIALTGRLHFGTYLDFTPSSTAVGIAPVQRRQRPPRPYRRDRQAGRRLDLYLHH